MYDYILGTHLSINLNKWLLNSFTFYKVVKSRKYFFFSFHKIQSRFFFLHAINIFEGFQIEQNLGKSLLAFGALAFYIGEQPVERLRKVIIINWLFLLNHGYRFIENSES